MRLGRERHEREALIGFQANYRVAQSANSKNRIILHHLYKQNLLTAMIHFLFSLLVPFLIHAPLTYS